MPLESISSPAGLPSVLERILRTRRPRVEAARRAVGESELRRRALDRTSDHGGDRRGFSAGLRAFAQPGRPAVIAELKQASPSRGRLRQDFDVAALAAGYASAGAAALSVLTEEDHFLGDLRYLGEARAATRLPILRKDFLFCPYQIWEAAAAGADAVLLIAAILDDASLRELLDVAEEAGLEALCEVHDAAELARVSAAGAKLIGVNNRDLHSFSVDIERAVALAGAMPAGALSVAESGLRAGADLARMAAAGYQAVLIGERFMEAGDPGAALSALLAGVPRRGFVKVCGVTSLADAQLACACGADAVGFVLADSPRQTELETVRAITPRLPAGVLRVGVFAGTPAGDLSAIALRCGLDAVQLHGPVYTPAAAQALPAGVEVWRAVGMNGHADAVNSEISAWAPVARGFVLDAAVAGRHGGTGVSFDWEQARGVAAQLAAMPGNHPPRLLVAGGLRTDNVATAIARSGAHGVDAASGTEASPGVKDAVRMREWMTAARTAFGHLPPWNPL